VGLPTIEHVIFIPAVLMLGMVLGYIMGSRATRAELERKRNRARD
jgi:hypothetical protein